jgi:hypothetical protein
MAVGAIVLALLVVVTTVPLQRWINRRARQQREAGGTTAWNRRMFGYAREGERAPVGRRLIGGALALIAFVCFAISASASSSMQTALWITGFACIGVLLLLRSWWADR